MRTIGFLVLALLIPTPAGAKTVHLSWKKTRRADSYEIELRSQEKVVSRFRVSGANEWSGEVKPGSYDHRVRAMDRLGRTSPWSRYRKLLILPESRGMGLPKDGFVLAFHDPKKPVTLKWNALGLAPGEQYHVQIASGRKVLLEQTSDRTELELLGLPSGEYELRVEPVVRDSSGANVLLPFERRKFSLLYQDLDAPKLSKSLPKEKASKSGISWAEVKGAVAYRVSVTSEGGSATPKQITIKDHFFSAWNLPNGKHQIQVAALSAEDLARGPDATGAPSQVSIEVLRLNSRTQESEIESMDLCSWTKPGTALALFLCSTSFAAPLEQTPPLPMSSDTCPTTQEYVKTLAYLRSEGDFYVSEPKARATAEQVAKGCDGAANRFIRVASRLSEAGLVSSDAIALGIQFAARESAQADAFIKIFDNTFSAAGLDLDLRNAIRIALALSVRYEGDANVAPKDFGKLTDYCTGKEELDLPKPTCAMFAARVTEEGGRWKGGVADAYIHLVSFIRSQKGPAYATGESLKLAEKVVSIGPGADQNFIRAFEFGMEKTGLSLASRDALGFALRMVQDQGAATADRALAAERRRTLQN